MAIYKSSPKTYRFFEKFLLFPSKKTLQRTLKDIKLKPGFNDKIFSLLNEYSKTLSKENKFCELLFDEVAIQPTLELMNNCVTGLVDYGSGPKIQYTDHALVFMLRGINCYWKQPISFYFSRRTTPSDTLKNLICETIKAVKFLTRPHQMLPPSINYAKKKILWKI